MIIIIQHKTNSDWKDIFDGVFKAELNVFDKENVVIDMKFKDGTCKAKEVDTTVYDIKMYND